MTLVAPEDNRPDQLIFFQYKKLNAMQPDALAHAHLLHGSLVEQAITHEA